MDNHDVKIAVLQSEIAGLREQHKAHKDETVASLNRLTETVFDAIGELREDIKEIFEFVNKSKGGLYTVIVASSGMGGIVVAVVSWALTRFVH